MFISYVAEVLTEYSSSDRHPFYVTLSTEYASSGIFSEDFWDLFPERLKLET